MGTAPNFTTIAVIYTFAQAGCFQFLSNLID